MTCTHRTRFWACVFTSFHRLHLAFAISVSISLRLGPGVLGSGSEWDRWVTTTRVPVSTLVSWWSAIWGASSLDFLRLRLSERDCVWPVGLSSCMPSFWFDARPLPGSDKTSDKYVNLLVTLRFGTLPWTFTILVAISIQWPGKQVQWWHLCVIS